MNITDIAIKTPGGARGGMLKCFLCHRENMEWGRNKLLVTFKKLIFYLFSPIFHTFLHQFFMIFKNNSSLENYPLRHQPKKPAITGGRKKKHKSGLDKEKGFLAIILTLELGGWFWVNVNKKICGILQEGRTYQGYYVLKYESVAFIQVVSVSNTSKTMSTDNGRRQHGPRRLLHEQRNATSVTSVDSRLRLQNNRELARSKLLSQRWRKLNKLSSFCYLCSWSSFIANVHFWQITCFIFSYIPQG